jgi:hypothetical protein
MKRQKKITIPVVDGYDLEGERKKLRDAADQLSIEIPQEFYDKIELGDIIEIYSNPPENKQLYRNGEFLKHSSYSPEQMETIPYPKLFWRSDETNFIFMKRIEQVALKENGVVPWGVDRHELVENLHPRKRTFEMDMRYLTPCFDKMTKERKAFAHTLRVTLIFEWPEDL